MIMVPHHLNRVAVDPMSQQRKKSYICLFKKYLRTHKECKRVTLVDNLVLHFQYCLGFTTTSAHMKKNPNWIFCVIFFQIGPNSGLVLYYGYYSGVGGNNSAQLLIYYNFMYIINPRICARFDLVTSYTLHHHLTIGGEGNG